MISKRLTITVVVGMLLMTSTLAVSVFGQGDESPQKATGAIQYKVVAVPGTMTQALAASCRLLSA
ncbi:MAG TPA: hypothetical protein VEW48_28300 [Thermoanaerobaculia bacterium]|nr:hypothetical protein [Thermoanaerobaculia bacterium]